MRRLLLAALALGLATPAAAQTIETIHSFSGQYLPREGTLALDAAGNLYGTTSILFGSVYRLAPTGGGAYSLTTLFTIANGPAATTYGARPYGGVALDPAGNIVLAPTLLGPDTAGGTVLRLAPDGGGTYTPSVAIDFSGPNGAWPHGTPIVDPGGNIFGATRDGGASNRGVVYRLAPDGVGGLTPTTLHEFSGADGASPYGPLLHDAAGNLYGSTAAGGSGNKGTVFRLAPDGSGDYTFATLFDFAAVANTIPYSGLAMAPDGTLFGTTIDGNGSIFSLTPDGSGGYDYALLHQFTGADGAYPTGTPILDAEGNLFGTAQIGGPSGDGTVWRLLADGAGGYDFDVIVTFDGTNGSDPEAGLVAGPDGSLFGTTARGGEGDLGAVYRIRDSGYVVADTAPIPEPATLALLAPALITLIARRRLPSSHR
jgi:uncharacterized repeat protein (TIGR03803 family)